MKKTDPEFKKLTPKTCKECGRISKRQVDEKTKLCNTCDESRPRRKDKFVRKVKSAIARRSIEKKS